MTCLQPPWAFWDIQNVATAKLEILGLVLSPDILKSVKQGSNHGRPFGVIIDYENSESYGVFGTHWVYLFALFFPSRGPRWIR